VITPRIIITGISESGSIHDPVSARILEVWEECKKIGFEILIPSQPFSLDDLKQWVCEVANETDFLLNIQEGASPHIFYKHSSQQELSIQLSSLMSQWTQTEFLDPAILQTEHSIQQFFTELPPLVWNIMFPLHITKKEMIFSIMGWITELYTTHHPLIQPEQVWPFRDVPSDHFAFDAIKKAKEKGVITGYKGGIFQPNGGITRGEILYILERLKML